AIEDISEVFNLLKHATGIDFSLYRQTTIQRRIQRRQALLQLESLRDYVAFLKEHPAEIEALHQDLLIKVTQFFRDPEIFEGLKSLVFPQLLQNRTAKQSFRLWVPGGATGEEAYELSICMLECREQKRSDVRLRMSVFVHV